MSKAPVSNVVANMKKQEEARLERRAKAEEQKLAKLARAQANSDANKVCDIDFDELIAAERQKTPQAMNHVSSSKFQICICIRKRPLFKSEILKGEIDACSVANPKVFVHEPKIKVDGITKYINNQGFNFDNCYSEHEDSHAVYEYQIKHLIPSLFQNGVVTCFAYGQTGSGKTFTVNSNTQDACNDLVKMSPAGTRFFMSFFEIYGGKVMDLLNKKNKLQIMEDAKGKIQVQGLTDQEASGAQNMIDIINYGHSERTTHQTEANDTSSRSHAICQIKVRDSSDKLIGKLLLVDLAGSERAQDTQSNNRNRRMEGAEINKSLLALKECIRALDSGASHVPFRASKLTMVLRDSFLNKTSAKIVMIACVNPGSTSADHTLNTLRYADRLKSGDSGAYKNPAAVGLQPRRQNQQEEPPAQKQAHPHMMAQPQKPQPQDAAPRQPPMSKEGREKFPPIQRAPAHQGQQEEQKRAKWGNLASPTNEQPHSSGQANRRPPVQSKGVRANSGARGPSKEWVNVADEQEQVQSAMGVKQNGGFQQQNNGGNAAKNRAYQQEQQNLIKSPEHRKMKMDDLRQTLGFGRQGNDQKDQNKIDNNLLTFHEKVDSLMDEEEELRIKHVEYVREAAKLLNQEGELIAKSQGVGAEEQDIEEYVNKMEHIVQRNLQIYTDLQNRIGRFKRLLKEEEEAHQNVRETFYY